MNELWLEEEGTPMPENIYGAKVDENGNAILVREDGSPIPETRGIPGKAWKVTKCAATLAVNTVPVAAAVKKVGSIKKVAQILIEANSKASVLQRLGAAGAAILDIDAIASNCGGNWADA